MKISVSNLVPVVILFLHGNPTSSYLWRNVMRYVKPAGRIIALDLIGFGKSDKPKELDYTFQTHFTYVEGFIKALQLKDIILVLHDWGSALGLHYGVTREKAGKRDSVRGVVFMEAIIPPVFPMASLQDMGAAADLFGRMRDEKLGKELLIEQNFFVEGILLNAPATRQLSDAEKEFYRSPFKDPASRFPIFVWPNELPIAGNPVRNVTVIEAIGDWLQQTPMPKLLQYASPGALINAQTANWMRANYANLETQFVGYGNHYIQEDNPEAIGRGILEWYRREFEAKNVKDASQL